MGIRVAWADEARSTMVWQFDPDWSWDDWHDATETAVKLRKASPSQPHVAVILNMPGTRVIPKNPLMHARKALERADSRDIVILVGGSFIRFLASTFREIYPRLGKRFHVVGSYDEALALAQRLHAEHSGS